MSNQYQAIEMEMISWKEEIGDIIRSLFRKTGELEFKFAKEAVTEADRAVEKMITDKILKAYPDDSVAGEEFGLTEGTSGRTWYLDPVDGTLNFALGLPNFCSSIALMEGDEVLATMVYQPLHHECFTAIKGGGARLNGKTIHVSNRPALGDAILSLQLQKGGRFVQNANLLQALVMESMKMRRFGTIALEMAYLADGRYDGIVAGRGRPQELYDVAPGILLVQEAGGKISDHLGKPYIPGSTDLIGTNAHIHDELIDLIVTHERQRGEPVD
ncbi:inositol monophosphatase [bacterium]|jgi:myo-inositol-1(or 4)-monophosphatase|nr:inositol monophosphatase [bacterium]